MVVVRYHLDDATAMPPAEREALRSAFIEAKLPPIVVETLAFVSADLKHDNAFVRHVNDKYVVPYMQSLGNFNTYYARSDGCNGQFKQAAHFDWVSRRQSETGMRTDWSFFCSCHGTSSPTLQQPQQPLARLSSSLAHLTPLSVITHPSDPVIR